MSNEIFALFDALKAPLVTAKQVNEAITVLKEELALAERNNFIYATHILDQEVSIPEHLDEMFKAADVEDKIEPEALAALLILFNNSTGWSWLISTVILAEWDKVSGEESAAIAWGSEKTRALANLLKYRFRSIQVVNFIQASQLKKITEKATPVSAGASSDDDCWLVDSQELFFDGDELPSFDTTFQTMSLPFYRLFEDSKGPKLPSPADVMRVVVLYNAAGLIERYYTELEKGRNLAFASTAELGLDKGQSNPYMAISELPEIITLLGIKGKYDAWKSHNEARATVLKNKPGFPVGRQAEGYMKDGDAPALVEKQS